MRLEQARARHNIPVLGMVATGGAILEIVAVGLRVMEDTSR
jgi:hypothetical protein